MVQQIQEAFGKTSVKSGINWPDIRNPLETGLYTNVSGKDYGTSKFSCKVPVALAVEIDNVQ